MALMTTNQQLDHFPMPTKTIPRGFLWIERSMSTYQVKQRGAKPKGKVKKWAVLGRQGESGLLSQKKIWRFVWVGFFWGETCDQEIWKLVWRGKQVAVNFHQLYPQNQPQLPVKLAHYVFQGVGSYPMEDVRWVSWNGNVSTVLYHTGTLFHLEFFPDGIPRKVWLMGWNQKIHHPYKRGFNREVVQPTTKFKILRATKLTLQQLHLRNLTATEIVAFLLLGIPVGFPISPFWWCWKDFRKYIQIHPLQIFVGPTIWCPGQSKKTRAEEAPKTAVTKTPTVKKKGNRGGNDGAVSSGIGNVFLTLFFGAKLEDSAWCFDDLLKLLCLSSWIVFLASAGWDRSVFECAGSVVADRQINVYQMVCFCTMSEYAVTAWCWQQVWLL